MTITQTGGTENPAMADRTTLERSPAAGDEKPSNGSARIQRPARSLIGWLEPQQAQLILAGQRQDLAGTPEHIARASDARSAVLQREAGVAQAGVVIDTPVELADHTANLCASGAGKTMVDEGWTVRLIDLTKVCAVQPNIFTDHAEARVEGTVADDLSSLAWVTLPLPGQIQLPTQFDPTKMTWMFSSPNPNLRVLGQFSAPLEEGLLGFGFVVGVSQSFLQVAKFRGRWLLRDGYHRAFGLLSRGISIVPAFVREFEPFQELGLPPGMLPPAAYLGDRPPVLSDYLDDSVAASVSLPAFQKMIVVQAMELTPLV